MYYVYIICNSARMLYVGVSTNPEKRVALHNSKQGAQFTRHIGDFKIVFLEKYKTMAEARRREIQIKKWRRAKKDAIIERYKKGLSTKIT